MNPFSFTQTGVTVKLKDNCLPAKKSIHFVKNLIHWLRKFELPQKKNVNRQKINVLIAP